MAKIVGIREQIGSWDTATVRWGWVALAAAGVAAAIWSSNPKKVRPNRKRPRRSMRRNPELRVVVRSPLGKQLAQYNVHAASLREAFNRAEDEAERLGVRVSDAARAGNTYTIVGTTKTFTRH